MIIAIPVEIDSKESLVSEHFGRSNYFLIYNSEEKEYKFVENSAAKSSGGAGIKAAQIVVDENAQVLVSPQLGQNAADVINGAKIKIYKAQVGSIKENLQALEEGKLKLLSEIHGGYHGN
ncbi:MAG TPA: NifB/NifX family molybdenum-iron cluster-binding protein [Clostridia bacterium]|nr:NifB/NifX family molybdenum-iron cluster-binding protein [Clostridia bacterium]